MGPAYIHRHGDFHDLLEIVSERIGVSAALVEKDYWVTHALWALESMGFRVSFKGGTSLSKAFGLIQRFSEDLDLKLEAPDLPDVTSWTSEGKRATESRRRFFVAIGERVVRVPDMEVVETEDDEHSKIVAFGLRYPSRRRLELPASVRATVRLEVGMARVTPGEERALTSWVHQYMEGSARDMSGRFVRNRPAAIHCVRPEVTLLEKVEALGRRYGGTREAGAFVRHYEDVVRILGFPDLFPLDRLRGLLGDMMETKDVRNWPVEDHPAFVPEADPERWRQVEQAWRAAAPLFWGARVPVAVCASRIREFLREMATGACGSPGEQVSS